MLAWFVYHYHNAVHDAGGNMQAGLPYQVYRRYERNAYHSPDYVLGLLEHLEVAGHLAEDLPYVRLALLYAPAGPRAAVRDLYYQAGLSKEAALRVGAILSSAQSGKPRGSDACLVADILLSDLAVSWEEHSNNVALMQAESGSGPLEHARDRASYLGELLARPRLYHHTLFGRALSEAALQNVKKELNETAFWLD